MKVLKSGRSANAYRTFDCYFCGCIFTAGSNEYWPDEDYGGYECACPECGRTCNSCDAT